ncbi:porin family protein [Sulfurovum sp.]|uniref:porin family protein n=1 Tax=Sulfurovum sp. TaxID=1969726 RepID=UPI0028681126|nr:porin family protein [Sulfurovum sp.]
MKKFNLSLVTVLAMSTFAIAGGDFKTDTPVEPVVEIIEEVKPYFYLGAAYADIHNGESGDGYGLIAGYSFMENLAVEARYASVETDNNHDITNTVIFLKPKVKVGDSLCIYGLLGYGQVDYVDVDDDGFEYGAGMAFHFNENIALFADYIQTKAIDDVKLHGFTTGLVYKF